MRYPITAFILLLSFASIAQVPYERTKVVEVDSVTTADELQARARRWFVDSFKDANEVIQMDDTKTNTIVGKGSFQYRPTLLVSSNGRVTPIRFSLEIHCRNGRYRLRLYDFLQDGLGALGPILSDSLHCSGSNYYRTTSGTPTKYHEKICLKEAWPQIHAAEVRLLSSLAAAMAKPSANDW